MTPSAHTKRREMMIAQSSAPSVFCHSRRAYIGETTATAVETIRSIAAAYTPPGDGLHMMATMTKR